MSRQLVKTLIRQQCSRGSLMPIMSTSIDCLQRAGFATLDQSSSSPPKTRPTKGFLQRAWDQYSITKQQHRIMVGERLFRAAQRQAMIPTWYNEGRIGRDFRPRHAILTLHVWLLQKRLVADEVDPHTSLMIQEELFDMFWVDTRIRIREQGLMEMTVEKHLRDVQQYTFQQCVHLDEAFSIGEDNKEQRIKRFEELCGVVWVHILERSEDKAHADHIHRLVAYIEYQYINIMKQLPDEYFREGKVGWGNLPEFSKMKDEKGKLLKPIPPEPQLPQGWIKCLTEAGKPYYWDTSKNKTQWEKP
mmetsp:Transcript_14209/g.21632  ORF Transcript_14209/g.21632 Transcript_14209/m.21632 type:complete len:303 (+) Transcript_14209:124-1032(+)